MLKQKKKPTKLESILRSRKFWFSLPFIIYLVYFVCYVIIDTSLGELGTGSLIHVDETVKSVFLLFFPAVFFFPAFIFVGMGILENTFNSGLFPVDQTNPIYIFAFYALMIFFLVKLPVLHKKILYWVSFVILLLLVIGLKGCLQLLPTY